MDPNPYASNPNQPPDSQTPITGVLSGTLEDLRSVAQYQKGVVVCILFYFLIGIGAAFIPDKPETAIFRAILGLVALGVVITGVVFVFLLSTKVYSPALGVFLGILTCVPCIGLIALLIVNQKATTVLTQNGFKVGLLGANMGAIDARIQAKSR